MPAKKSSVMCDKKVENGAEMCLRNRSVCYKTVSETNKCMKMRKITSNHHNYEIR